MVTIEETTSLHAPIQRCFDLSRSVEVHLLGNIHFRESATAVGGRTTGLIELGERVTWRAKHFWVWHVLTSEIVRLQSPTYFRDVMVRGIFRSMTHDHYFRQLAGARQRCEIFLLSPYRCRHSAVLRR